MIDCRLVELFVGIMVVCMPSASHTCRQLLPSYKVLKSKVSRFNAFHLFQLSSTKSSYSLERAPVQGRPQIDPSERRKSSFDRGKYYENLSDIESILPQGQDLQMHIYRSSENGTIADGHMPMIHGMQRSVS